MGILKLSFAMALLFSSSLAFAHGELKPGPHGGVIRMPGAFHTEVVVLGSHKIKIYLLDISFQNPSVSDSSVKATFAGTRDFEAHCTIEARAFICSFDQTVELSSPGKLRINAMRENQGGNEVEYQTPLKLSATENKMQQVHNH